MLTAKAAVRQTEAANIGQVAAPAPKASGLQTARYSE